MLGPGIYRGCSVEDEDFVILEPTDPDEDRLKAAEALISASQQENTPVPAQISLPPSSKPEVISIDILKNGIPGDPAVLNQILKALTAKNQLQQPQQLTPSIATTISFPQTLPMTPTLSGQPRFLVASTNNVLTLQAPIQANGGAGSPVQSFMVQSLNGLEAARLINLPAALQQAVAVPSTTAPTTVQQLLTSSPSLSGVLVNCATANLLTQLANSISSSMLSFAQTVAADRVVNPAAQIAEVSQMLAVLTSLANNLASALPGLANIRSVSTASTAPQVPSTILSSLIAHPHTIVNTPLKPAPPPPPPLPSLPPPPPPPPPATIVVPIKPQTISPFKPEPASPRNGAQLSPISHPTVGLRTRSGFLLSSVRLSRPRRFICIYSGCAKAFNARFNLVEHLRIHQGEFPFVCPEFGCKKRFKKRRLLWTHAKTHDTPKDSVAKLPNQKYQCPLVGCEERFVQRRLLNQHVAEHTEAGVFSCECSAKFSLAKDFIEHSHCHDSDWKQVYLCPYEACCKAYPKISRLREHVMMHSGDKPHSCPHAGCNASFIKLNALRRHQMEHMAEIRQAVDATPTSIASAKSNAVPPTSMATVLSTIVTSPPAQIFVQAIAPSGVHLKTLLAAAAHPKSGLSTPLKPEPNESSTTTTTIASIPVTSAVTMTPQITIGGPVTNGMLPKVPLVQRSPKAAATPSASALAEKAIVVAGPFGRRRHICPMAGCTKIFPKLNKLREHICRHTGERPYACQECPATFVRMYDLRRHAMIHMRKKNSILSTGI